MFGQWYRSKFNSLDRAERNYAYLLTYLSVLTFLFIIIKPFGLGAPICTLWCMMLVGLSLIQVWGEQNEEQWKLVELSKLAQFILLLIAVAVYYDGVNVVNRARYQIHGDELLYDEALVHADTLLLGRWFPRGQLALYLDTEPNFGATSYPAIFYHEILQIFYVSYYFWGNAIGVYFAFLYFYRTVFKGGKYSKKRIEWRRIQMFLCAWVGTFLVNFTFNLMFPAVSPRIYLRGLYVNELRGLWLTTSLRGALVKAAQNTFSAFPSGHCGLSWLAAFIALRCRLPTPAIAAQTVAAFIISAATIVMRYHYFVDFLAGFILVVVGAYWGCCTSNDEFASTLAANGTNDKFSAEEEAMLLNMAELGDAVAAVKKEQDTEKE